MYYRLSKDIRIKDMPYSCLLKGVWVEKTKYSLNEWLNLPRRREPVIGSISTRTLRKLYVNSTKLQPFACFRVNARFSQWQLAVFVWPMHTCDHIWETDCDSAADTFIHRLNGSSVRPSRILACGWTQGESWREDAHFFGTWGRLIHNNWSPCQLEYASPSKVMYRELISNSAHF